MVIQSRMYCSGLSTTLGGAVRFKASPAQSLEQQLRRPHLAECNGMQRSTGNVLFWFKRYIERRYTLHSFTRAELRAAIKEASSR